MNHTRTKLIGDSFLRSLGQVLLCSTLVLLSNELCDAIANLFDVPEMQMSAALDFFMNRA